MESDTEKKRHSISRKLVLIITFVLIGALVISVTMGYILYTTDTHDKAMYGKKSIMAFVVVFLCYGFAALLLVMFFAYRILSPFGRLIKEMDVILGGEFHRRLFLRDRDVYLVKCFVRDVNTILEKLHKMNVVQDEILKHLETEGEDLINLIEKDDNISTETRDAIIKHHRKVKSLVKDTDETSTAS